MTVFNFALRFACEKGDVIDPVSVRFTRPHETIEGALQDARQEAAAVKAGLEAPRWMGLVRSDIRVKRIDVAILDEAGLILKPFCKL